MTKMKILAVWSCTGGNVSELSFALARRLSEQGKTLICELPCLGVPRLGFVSEHLERTRNTENALLALEHGESLSWSMVSEDRERLWVLPASVYAVPDCPVTARVSIETLIHFSGELQRLAEMKGIDYLVFDCQGQLTSPMSFFALRLAGQIVVPLEQPADLAFTLTNLRRLVKIYRYSPEQFLLAVDGELKAVEALLRGKGRKASPLSAVRVLSKEPRKLAAALDWQVVCRAGAEQSGQGEQEAALTWEAEGLGGQAALSLDAEKEAFADAQSSLFLAKPESAEASKVAKSLPAEDLSWTETGERTAVSGCSVRL